MITIGNAPCSWGVEFADDPRNPPWRQVLRENAEAGYTGIEPWIREICFSELGFQPSSRVSVSCEILPRQIGGGAQVRGRNRDRRAVDDWFAS